MTHQFDIDVAQEYGVNAAIILNNIAFWVVKNEANEENFIDGRYWTYNSVTAFNRLFPYLTPCQIRYAINKLIEEEIIITANYSQDRRDRTTWYALTEKGRCICKIPQMHLLINANAFENNSKCINSNINNNILPDVNADINTDNPPISPKGETPAKPKKSKSEDFNEFWAIYPRKDGKKKAAEAWAKIKPDEKMTPLILSAVKNACQSPQWTKDSGQFIPMPSTYLNQRRWEDEGTVSPEPESKYRFLN
ncbi:MAG TPA: hypothetical protein PKL77_08575 [Candidatus Omnitrophota bacterium]|nr:hypothetical protein [Candidatus Omnitrophota bacterium]